MTVRLVFVHGIGGPRDADTELDQWTKALAAGAREGGHERFADEVLPALDRRFVYYGDLFHGTGKQGADDELPDEENLRALLDNVISNLLENEQDADTEEKLRRALLRLQPKGQAQGGGAVAGPAINATTTLMTIQPLQKGAQWLSGRKLLGSLGQVGRYLSPKSKAVDGSALAPAAQDRILDALGDTSIVIAHSLGSVVAYEALHRTEKHVPMFLTLGSPLALRTFVKQRVAPRPLRTPECVRQWLNFWDKDDIVAARPIPARSTAPNSAGVGLKGKRIQSDGVWTHTATKYLRDARVAGQIAQTVDRHGESPQR